MHDRQVSSYVFKLDKAAALDTDPDVVTFSSKSEGKKVKDTIMKAEPPCHWSLYIIS